MPKVVYVRDAGRFDDNETAHTLGVGASAEDIAIPTNRRWRVEGAAVVNNGDDARTFTLYLRKGAQSLGAIANFGNVAAGDDVYVPYEGRYFPPREYTDAYTFRFAVGAAGGWTTGDAILFIFIKEIILED